MKPVIGLDVAKGESQVQAFLDKKHPYKKSFKVTHTLEGLRNLLDFIREVEEAIRSSTSYCFGVHWTLSHTSCPVFRGQRLLVDYGEPTYIISS
jgi:hypothetical protein